MVKSLLIKYSKYAVFTVIILGLVSLSFNLERPHFSNLNSFSENEKSTVVNAELLPERNSEEIDFKKDGVYPLNISGEITIHGVTKEIETKGIFTVKGKKISTKAFLKIQPKDYDIR